MNQVKKIEESKILYNSTQNSILKYMSMRKRMKTPVVTIDEIINFFKPKIIRKDNLINNMKKLTKHNYITKINNGFIITNIGMQVPFVVANSHQRNLIKNGKRINLANDWDE